LHRALPISFTTTVKNGILPIVLDEAIIDQLFKECAATEGYKLDVGLQTQSVTTPSGQSFGFGIDAFRKHCLINGLDDIGLTLQDADSIHAYEANRSQSAPWLF